jgi:hypothetical protein
LAKERSEKSKYPSRYSPQGWVTAAQYIVELACEKKAKKEKKDLPTQFWKLKDWATFYRSQINTANALVKKYGEQAVIAALKNEKTFWMYSLRAPGFEAIIQQEEQILKVKKSAMEALVTIANQEETREVVDTTTVPKTYTAPSRTDKLRDL